MPIGSALFIVVEPHKETLESTCAKLAACFPRADRLSRSRDPEEQKRLKEELARITFGETLDAGRA